MPAITGFVAGLFASIFATGVRKMLAPAIIRRKISVGAIKKPEKESDRYWRIPISVKANKVWILLVSSVDNVKAIINFIEHKGNKKICRQYQATWINPDIDDPLVSLHIGSEYEIRLAGGSDGILHPIGEISDDTLTGNQDVLLELRSDNIILGRWIFQKAIVAGSVQEISPIKIKI